MEMTNVLNDTKECDCESDFEKCNCIQKELNYCNKTLNSNCKLNLISKFQNETITICNDGTCSIDNKCPNNLTCPIGYIKYQNKCIFSEVNVKKKKMKIVKIKIKSNVGIFHVKTHMKSVQKE